VSATTQFAKIIKQRYTNYADASFYTPDTIGYWKMRVDRPGEQPFIVFRAAPINQSIILYTYNKMDSCIIYSGVLENRNYTIDVNTFAVPRGRYILNIGNVVDTISIN
jgi:hypothetical protein